MVCGFPTFGRACDFNRGLSLFFPLCPCSKLWSTLNPMAALLRFRGLSYGAYSKFKKGEN